MQLLCFSGGDALRCWSPGTALPLLLLLVTGCLSPACLAAAEGPAPASVTVRVHMLPTSRSTAPSEVAAYRVVQRFLQLHPGIRLESAVTLQIENAKRDAAPLMAIAGRTSPDVIYVNFRQSDTYIREGFLYPLDEYIAELPPEELSARIPEPVRPVVYRPGPDGDSHYWAMPQEVVAAVLMYRKDLFAQAGLDPARPPQDWKKLEEYARAIADPGSRRYGLMFTVGSETAYSIFPYLSSAGAHAVVQLPNGEWKADFATPEAVTAYAFVDHLMKATVTKGGKTGPIAYRGADAVTLAMEGRIGMYFGYLGSTELATFNPDVVAVAPIPRGPTGLSKGEINARMLGIFAGVKDKRVRDAAWEYIRFLGSKESRRVYTDVMVELGASHLLNPLWLEEFGYRDLAKLAHPGLVATYRNAVRNGVPEPYGKNCQFVYYYLSRPIDKIYHIDFTGMSPAERAAIIQPILQTAVDETDEQMLGRLLPEVRLQRNSIAWVVAVAILGAFGAFIYHVFKWMSEGVPQSTPESGNGSLLAAAFILPALALVLVWQYYPLARGSLMAFQDYKIMAGTSWVGIDNFADILFDKRFWLSLANSFYFCGLWLLLGFLPPVFLAIILQEISLGKVLFRVLFYIPAVVSGVVILFMWRAIYDPSPEGVLNRLIGALGLPAQTWLRDPDLAMFCVVLPLAWANLGPGSIIYLAALKGIPDELYEASDIDGAGFVEKLRFIVLPYLKPLLVINVVGATIFGFKSTDAVLAMTGGGPDNATQVAGYEIWQRSFLFLKFGQGTAMAWVLGLILMSFTAYQMRVLARVDFRTART